MNKASCELPTDEFRVITRMLFERTLFLETAPGTASVLDRDASI